MAFSGTDRILGKGMDKLTLIQNIYGDTSHVELTSDLELFPRIHKSLRAIFATQVRFEKEERERC